MPLVNTNGWDWSKVEPQEEVLGTVLQAGCGVTTSKLDAGGLGGSARGLLLAILWQDHVYSAKLCPRHHRLAQGQGAHEELPGE